MKATYDKTMRTQYPCRGCQSMILTGACNFLGETMCDRCYDTPSEYLGGRGRGDRMQWPDDYKRQVDEEARHADQA